MVTKSVLHSLCALYFCSEWVHSQTLPGMYERHDETIQLLQKSARIHVTPSSGREQVLRGIVEDVTNALGPTNAKFLNQHSPHVGKSKDIPVPYEIRKGPAGMGLFATKPIAKGQITWRFNPENHKEIYESDVPMLRRLLQNKDRDVALSLVRWTYAFPEHCKGECVLYEMDDGRYTNDDGRYTNDGDKENEEEDEDEDDEDEDELGANQASDATGEALVATRAIPANTELLEDYTEDYNSEDVPGWWQKFIDEIDNRDS